MLDINQECYGQYIGISGLAFPYLPIEKMQNYKNCGSYIKTMHMAK